jgi:hypothetical protein
VRGRLRGFGVVRDDPSSTNANKASRANSADPSREWNGYYEPIKIMKKKFENVGRLNYRLCTH